MVSVLAYRQAKNAAHEAKNAALLSKRVEVINHVRTAMSDVTVHGNITARTVDSIREPHQSSSLVFGSTVSDVLDQSYGIAVRLQHTPFDERTDQYVSDKRLLEKNLDSVLKAMIEEARLGK